MVKKNTLFSLALLVMVLLSTLNFVASHEGVDSYGHHEESAEVKWVGTAGWLFTGGLFIFLVILSVFLIKKLRSKK